MIYHTSHSIFLNFEAYLLLTLPEEELLPDFDGLRDWIYSRSHQESNHFSDSPLSLHQYQFNNSEYQLNSYESFLQSLALDKTQQEETPLPQIEQGNFGLLNNNKELNHNGVENSMELERGFDPFYDNNMELEEQSKLSQVVSRAGTKDEECD